MDNSSLCVSPVSKITAGAFIGLCGGALITPQRDSLKRILVQNPDYFEKIFTPSVMTRMSDEEIGALSILKGSSTIFRKSGCSQNNAIRNAAKEWYNRFNAIEVDEVLSQRLKNKKTFLQKAIYESGIININRRLGIVDKAFMDAPDNLVMRDEIIELGKNQKKAHSTLKYPLFEYREALNSVKKDRLQRMKSLPNSGLEVRKLFEKMESEVAKKRTIMSNKLYELTNTPLLKESYAKIKRFLPESRMPKALKGAAFLGTLTAIWLIFFNPSSKK